MQNKYNFFSKYVLRTPLLPVDVFQDITSKKNISDSKIKEILKNETIKEAIYIASPALYLEINKWLNDEKRDEKKVEKLKISILKYLSRMSNRATPFGMFAGCALGEINKDTLITIGDYKKNFRKTRLDMNFLIEFSQTLAKKAKIKAQLLFYPNTSIYQIDNKLRYVEYRYINNKRFHQIIEINNSSFLEDILKIVSNGEKVDKIVLHLESKGIKKDRAEKFVNELIESQILVSELEPSITGDEFENQFVKILVGLSDIDDVLDIIKGIISKTTMLDQKSGNQIEKYNDLINSIENLNIKYDLSHLIQTDMFLDVKENFLSERIAKSVLKGITILNKITLSDEENRLSNFKNKFQEKFEEREIPLSKALDTEIGIPYNIEMNSGDFNPLIDGIVLPRGSKMNDAKEIKWSKFDNFLNKKIIEAYKRNDYVINITKNDFEGWEVNWDDLPDTMSTIIEILCINGEKKIKLNSIGGSSAANLLSRFCFGDYDIKDFVKEIVDVEKQINKDSILAEIIHLPEARVGNILMRPFLRDFEIPYLGKSNLNTTNQIKIDDILISVRNNEIVLRSKKYKRKILPYLTTAHNYSYNSIPIYNFLCDIQNQKKRVSLNLNLNNLTNNYNFIPRIEFEDIIFSEAMWVIQTENLSKLMKIEKSEDLISEMNLFREKRNIPQYISLNEGDNRLIVNLCNCLSINMFLNSVKNKKTIMIKEFLFNKECVVKDLNGKNYSNEIILSFYNEQKLKNNKS